MTKFDLAEARRVAEEHLTKREAATKEPWVLRPRKHDDWGVVVGGDGLPVLNTAVPSRYTREDCGKPEGPPPIKENAEFTCYARNSEVDRLLLAACERVEEYDQLVQRVWPIINDERGRLIDASHAGETVDEARLNKLQEVASHFLDVVAPLPLDKLEELERRLGLPSDFERAQQAEAERDALKQRVEALEAALKRVTASLESLYSDMPGPMTDAMHEARGILYPEREGSK